MFYILIPVNFPQALSPQQTDSKQKSQERKAQDGQQDTTRFCRAEAVHCVC
jgi:hypothetical protein